jgi:hypothetical protein
MRSIGVDVRSARGARACARARAAIMRLGTGKIGVRPPYEVELADGRIAARAQALFEERRDGVVAHPRADVAARAIGRSEGMTSSGASSTRRCVPRRPSSTRARGAGPPCAGSRSHRPAAGSPTRRGCNARARRRSAAPRGGRERQEREQATRRVVSASAYLRALIRACQAR